MPDPAPFGRLAIEDLPAIFNETAARRGLGNPTIVEKDFWVCWTLDRLFRLPTQGHPALIFKGGTSLSKVYKAINRFSEDIDVAIDRNGLGFTDDRDPRRASSQKAADRLLEQLSARCGQYVQHQLVPALQAIVTSEIGPAEQLGWEVSLDPVDAQTIIFKYPISGDEPRSAGYVA